MFDYIESVSEILKREWGYSIQRKNDGVVFDTSSTNIVMKIDNDYVVKIKPVDSNGDFNQWQCKALSMLNINGLCNVLIPSKTGDYYVYEDAHQYCFMKYCRGESFQFGNKRQLFLVADFINKLQKIKVTPLESSYQKFRYAPKSEALDSILDPICFENNIAILVKIAEVLKIDITIILCAVKILCNLNLTDFSNWNVVLSHGEMQGQNMHFDVIEGITMLDWDSLSLRPAIYDIAMATCFLCRRRKGRFVVDKNLVDYFLSQIKLSGAEKRYLYDFMRVVFIPDIKLLTHYYSVNKEKAQWYLEWSNNALKDINEWEIKEIW